MDIKEKVIEQQRRLLNRLSAYEDVIASLYDVYASAFPELADFWRELARDERKHVTYLSALHEFLDKGNVFYGLKRFKDDVLEAGFAEVQKELDVASGGPVALQHALNVALDIESLLLDGHFYSVAKSEDDAFSLIADHLLKDEQAHLEMVKSMFSKHFSSTWDVPAKPDHARSRAGASGRTQAL